MHTFFIDNPFWCMYTYMKKEIKMPYIFDPKKIIELRKSKGLTQSKFGKTLNTARQKVSVWEDGITKPNMKSLETLCNTFDVEPNYFFISSTHT